MIRVRHSRVQLAVHELKSADGPRLLALHGLGERSPSALPGGLASWPGPVYALDFTGHGDSTVPAGGGYTPEFLMGDVDAALDRLGECTLVGRGLGGYVALLVAGGRPRLVRGAVLCDGPGLTGGGPTPGSPFVKTGDPSLGPPDPLALLDLASDVRPPDYATSFVRLALQFSELDEPVVVCARSRPPWLQAVVEEPGVVEGLSLPAALGIYASTTQTP